jgi:hypothetical protein
VCVIVMVTFSFEVLVFFALPCSLVYFACFLCRFSYLGEIVSFFLVIESFLFVFSLLLLRSSVLRSVVSVYLVW